MSTDQNVRLRAVLDDLIDGRVSLSDAAALVRTMHFPEMPPKTISQQMAESYQREIPAQDPPGSFRSVSRAYVAGMISARQYEVLAEAAAEAIRGDQERKHGDVPHVA